jgi:hypothetical protein
MEREIKEFVEAVGAIEPKPSDESYSLFKSVFKRSNYFKLNRKFLIEDLRRALIYGTYLTVVHKKMFYVNEKGIIYNWRYERSGRQGF